MSDGEFTQLPAVSRAAAHPHCFRQHIKHIMPNNSKLGSHTTHSRLKTQDPRSNDLTIARTGWRLQLVRDLCSLIANNYCDFSVSSTGNWQPVVVLLPDTDVHTFVDS